MKTYRTINVTQSGRDITNGHKVISVALPQNLIGRSTQHKIPDVSSPRSDEDCDGMSLSKNALLARENRLKKKRYINGLEENLSEAKKENESLVEKLKEKDAAIEKLQKEIQYFKSILANVNEISGLIKTIKQESSIPLTTSLAQTPCSLKRSAPDLPHGNAIKKYRTSEGTNNSSSFLFDDDSDDWMPRSPPCTTQLDPESLDVLSNFSEEDINLFGDNTPIPESSRLEASAKAGVCLHVYDKKLSLEFCVTCATRAQEKWSCEA